MIDRAGRCAEIRRLRDDDDRDDDRVELVFDSHDQATLRIPSRVEAYYRQEEVA